VHFLISVPAATAPQFSFRKHDRPLRMSRTFSFTPLRSLRIARPGVPFLTQFPVTPLQSTNGPSNGHFTFFLSARHQNRAPPRLTKPHPLRVNFFPFPWPFPKRKATLFFKLSPFPFDAFTFPVPAYPVPCPGEEFCLQPSLLPSAAPLFRDHHLLFQTDPLPLVLLLSIF